MVDIPIKTIPHRIVSRRLTTCNVTEDGKAIRLDFTERTGDPVSIELPFEQAESVVMTLPRLLSSAVRGQTGSADMRYVFWLGQWSLEPAMDQKCLILTMRTPDGFEVAFGVPFEACQAMGWALKHDGDAAVDGD